MYPQKYLVLSYILITLHLTVQYDISSIGVNNLLSYPNDLGHLGLDWVALWRDVQVWMTANPFHCILPLYLYTHTALHMVFIIGAFSDYRVIGHVCLFVCLFVCLSVHRFSMKLLEIGR